MCHSVFVLTSCRVIIRRYDTIWQRHTIWRRNGKRRIGKRRSGKRRIWKRRIGSFLSQRQWKQWRSKTVQWESIRPETSLPLSVAVKAGKTIHHHHHHHHYHHHHHHLSLNRAGRWGTTDGFRASFLYFPLFCTTLWDLANSRPVHSLMLSSHLFLCLPCLLPPFTVPCKMVLARPDEREIWLYHCSLRLFTIQRYECIRIMATTVIIPPWLQRNVR